MDLNVVFNFFDLGEDLNTFWIFCFRFEIQIARENVPGMKLEMKNTHELNNRQELLV